MKIQDKTTEQMYEKGRKIATNLFIEQVVNTAFTSKNLEKDIATLAENYSIDVDAAHLSKEIKNILKTYKKGK